MTSVSLLFTCILAAEPGNWPGFLGQPASAINSDTLPLRWSPTENLAWKSSLPGYGQSSPIIWQDHVYVTSVEGEMKEQLHVLCYSLADGALAWQKTHTSSYPEKNSVYISRAAPTPVADSAGVYTYFESGDVVAFNHSGEMLWSRSLTTDYGPPKNEFGLSASPVQMEDRIAILIDDVEQAYLVALSKASGEVLWKTDRTPRKSWSSPALVYVDGQPQIVCSSGGSVDGYNATSGERLWSYAEVGGNTATTPIGIGSNGFLIGASPGRDGENSELAKKSNGLMSVGIDAKGAWQPRFVWTNPGPTPSWASPIVHRGFAYWVNRVGAVFCLDVQTGAVAYTVRIPQSAWVTPVGVDDRIYVFGKDGLTTVLAAGEEFEVLAENSLWSEDEPPLNRVPSSEGESDERRQSAAMFSRPTVYGAAIVDGSIVLRTGSQVFCIRQSATP
ncbi:MAG: PQQ-binding-like beta-propeller repeat protein [Planctomycetaceae bacterium]